MASSSWALSQLSQILPIDHDSLQQILDYTSTLSKDAAADHLKDILGDSPKALEFISSYNSRRQAPPTSSKPIPEPAAAVPRSQAKKRGKPPLNKLPAPRQVDNHGNTTGAYQKKAEEDYMGGNRKGHNKQQPALASSFALSDKPEARQLPKPVDTPSLKPPPSASGPLISDLPNVRTGSRTSSRTSSPAPRTTVNIAGGSSMRGASTTLQDLDSAIRTLELQTNPSLNSTTAESTSARACTCNATRHALLAAAPNCLNCGKIICAKEGIGPCTFCGTPLLSSADVTSMIESLKHERGQERMLANNNAPGHRRADVSSTARPFTASASISQTPDPASPTPTPPIGLAAGGATPPKTLDLAKQHRDRLLRYQADNARRTLIHDEAADYETPHSGLSQWSSPLERAAQLKRQQKVLREQEGSAKPEWEKRKVVVSVDLVRGKVVRKMAERERPGVGQHGEAGSGLEDEGGQEGEGMVNGRGGMAGSTNTGNGPRRGGDTAGGAFSQNPLLGNLIRPVWKARESQQTEDADKGKGKGKATESDANKENRPRQSPWRRRVQDDDPDDNEAVILDGGVYGGGGDDG